MKSVEKIRKGDFVELLHDIKNAAHLFSKGEILEVDYVDMFGLDLSDRKDKSRWITEVSQVEVKRVEREAV